MQEVTFFRRTIFEIAKPGVFFAFLAMSVFGVVLVFPFSADAAGWWGDGARSPEWILKRGGTIIRYTIKNTSGDRDEYKAVLYDSKGRYVEVEYGVKGLFDDAKNGTYSIKADRGIKNKETYRGGKSFAHIDIRARPGETITVVFDYKKRSASFSTDFVSVPPKKKPVAPSVPPAPSPIPADSATETVFPPPLISPETTLPLSDDDSSFQQPDVTERTSSLSTDQKTFLPGIVENGLIFDDFLSVSFGENEPLPFCSIKRPDSSSESGLNLLLPVNAEEVSDDQLKEAGSDEENSVGGWFSGFRKFFNFFRFSA